jgi:hypothetical protein
LNPWRDFPGLHTLTPMRFDLITIFPEFFAAPAKQA